MNSKIKWQEPPAKATGRPRTNIDLFIEEMQENPGRWALVAVNVHSANVATWNKRGCETTSRKKHLREIRHLRPLA